MYLDRCEDMRDQLQRWIWCQEILKIRVLFLVDDYLEPRFNIVTIPLALLFISDYMQILLYHWVKLFWDFPIALLNAQGVWWQACKKFFNLRLQVPLPIKCCPWFFDLLLMHVRMTEKNFLWNFLMDLFFFDGFLGCRSMYGCNS